MHVMALFWFVCIYLDVQNILEANRSNYYHHLLLESGILVEEPKGEYTILSVEFFSHISFVIKN